MLSGFRKPKNIAVFISGAGSTLQALLEMQHHICISLVVVNKKKSLGLLKAKRFGKNICFFDNSQMTYNDLNLILKKHNIDFIILAGYMKILPKSFTDIWVNKIINIHPSLLPSYPGLKSIEKSWLDNSKMGVSLHQVTDKMDEGAIILQQCAIENPQTYVLSEADLFMRRTEQFLLREVIMRYF